MPSILNFDVDVLKGQSIKILTDITIHLDKLNDFIILKIKYTFLCANQSLLFPYDFVG